MRTGHIELFLMRWEVSDMNRQFGIGLLVGGCFGLVGVGTLIDAIGGVTVRTNIAPDNTALAAFNPLLPGATVKPTWTVAKDSVNKEVELILVTEVKDFSLVRTKFIFGGARIQVPCDIASGNARLELVGQQDSDVISSVAVEILPPGPDCVR